MDNDRRSDRKKEKLPQETPTTEEIQRGQHNLSAEKSIMLGNYDDPCQEE
jgi:hypothetical protein